MNTQPTEQDWANGVSDSNGEYPFWSEADEAAASAEDAEFEHQADKARAARHWGLSDTLALKAAFGF
jgi:hypothetical protein